MRFAWYEVNGVNLHCAHLGREEAPMIIVLHGFPEFWIAWREVAELLSQDFYIVVLDQRGYNLSSKPAGIDAYHVSQLVADVSALADQLSPGRKFALAGHDWGASVAYGYAFSHPHRLTHLIVVNGVHPVCYQRAILFDLEQRRASQYINTLRRPSAAERLSEGGYRRTMRMLSEFSRTDWMTVAKKREYLDAWSQPGAMRAMVNWYLASQVQAPKVGVRMTDAPLLKIPDDKVTVRAPHLVVWGEADEALRPSCLTNLHHYAPDLAIKRISGAGHWILHEQPDEVASAIRAFVGASS